jgi:hypothetical protein
MTRMGSEGDGGHPVSRSGRLSAECHDELLDDRDRFTEHAQHGSSVVQVVRGSASLGWHDMQTLIRVRLNSRKGASASPPPISAPVRTSST